MHPLVIFLSHLSLRTVLDASWLKKQGASAEKKVEMRKVLITPRIKADISSTLTASPVI